MDRKIIEAKAVFLLLMEKFSSKFQIVSNQNGYIRTHISII